MRMINNYDSSNISQVYSLTKTEVISFIHKKVYGSDVDLVSADESDTFRFLVISSLDTTNIVKFCEDLDNYSDKHEILYTLNYRDLTRTIPKRKALFDLVEAFKLMEFSMQKCGCVYEVECSFINDTLYNIKYKQVNINNQKKRVRTL